MQVGDFNSGRVYMNFNKLRAQSGAALTEYALMLGLLLVVAVPGVAYLGGELSNAFTRGGGSWEVHRMEGNTYERAGWCPDGNCPEPVEPGTEPEVPAAED